MAALQPIGIYTIPEISSIGRSERELQEAKIDEVRDHERDQDVERNLYGEECARRMKGSVLELGGKDPMIVCADANLHNAVSGCLWGGFVIEGDWK